MSKFTDEIEYREDRLNSIIDALPDITLILDEDGRYIEILTSQHDLLYDELQKLKGNVISDVLPEETASLMMTTIKKTIATGKKQVVEYQLDVPHGRVSFEGRVSPMKQTVNNKHLVVWIAVDVTEHKKMAAQFKHSQKMEAIGILAGGIAHEFNNLLSPILGYADLLLSDKKDTDKDYRGLEQILLAGNRAKLLVKQLLAYGRQSTSEKENVQLDKVLSDALKLLKNTIPSNIDIQTNIEQFLPPVWGMPNEIHQVILNLSLNASHAMPDGGQLHYCLEKTKLDTQKDTTDYICLEVSDTGNGMTDEIIDRIFDPFFTTKNVGQGSGLGLSVVQGIVEQHRGIIEVESTPNIGSTFKLYFPVTENIISKTDKKPIPIEQGDERILLVDDELMILEITSKMLKKLNYQVKEFSDAEKAIEYFSESPESFDLLIVDYGMPQMNGKQFADEIKRINSDIPILLCTGYGDLISKESIDEWGMNGLIIKPFKINELSEVVRKVLNTIDKQITQT